MKKAFATLVLLFATVLPLRSQPAAKTAAKTTNATMEVCVLETSLGTMVFRLFPQEAPATVAHFRKLIQEGFYNGKPFYRVVKGHVIQTGDGGESGRPPIKAEFNSHLHVTGALGLAHGPEPNSGSTEIYVCLAPRPHLDGKFTVFGQVIEGLDVLERIGNVPVNEKFVDGGIAFHEPKEPVLIRKARLETRPAK